jgi:hypothetical protein
LGIEKTQANDATVICCLNVSSKQCDIKNWAIKPMRKRSEKKISAINGFYHRDFVQYTKRNGDRYLAYITALYPEKNQCNMATMEGKILKRYDLSRLSLIWRFNKIYWF